jgi:hypothetical protein
MDGGGGGEASGVLGAPKRISRHRSASKAGETDDPFVVQERTRGADMKTFQRKSLSGQKPGRPRAPARSKSHHN